MPSQISSVLLVLLLCLALSPLASAQAPDFIQRLHERWNVSTWSQWAPGSVPCTAKGIKNCAGNKFDLRLVNVGLLGATENLTIPSFLCNTGPYTFYFKRLELVGLNLTGPLPSGRCWTGAGRLDLSNNQLTGSLPKHAIQHSNNYGEGSIFLLRNNRFTGSVPSPVGLPGSEENLAWLDVSSNDLSGTIPGGWFGTYYVDGLNFAFNPRLGGEVRGLEVNDLRALILTRTNVTGTIDPKLCTIFDDDLGTGGFSLLNVPNINCTDAAAAACCTSTESSGPYFPCGKCQNVSQGLSHLNHFVTNYANSRLEGPNVHNHTRYFGTIIAVPQQDANDHGQHHRVRFWGPTVWSNGTVTRFAMQYRKRNSDGDQYNEVRVHERAHPSLAFTVVANFSLSGAPEYLHFHPMVCKQDAISAPMGFDPTGRYLTVMRCAHGFAGVVIDLDASIASSMVKYREQDVNPLNGPLLYNAPFPSPAKEGMIFLSHDVLVGLRAYSDQQEEKLYKRAGVGLNVMHFPTGEMVGHWPTPSRAIPDDGYWLGRGGMTSDIGTMSSSPGARATQLVMMSGSRGFPSGNLPVAVFEVSWDWDPILATDLPRFIPLQTIPMPEDACFWGLSAAVATGGEMDVLAVADSNLLVCTQNHSRIQIYRRQKPRAGEHAAKHQYIAMEEITDPHGPASPECDIGESLALDPTGTILVMPCLPLRAFDGTAYIAKYNTTKGEFQLLDHMIPLAGCDMMAADMYTVATTQDLLIIGCRGQTLVLEWSNLNRHPSV